MPAAASENKSFELIWQEWLSADDLEARVRGHLSERRPFLEFVEKCALRVRKQSSELRVLELGCGTAIDSMYLAPRLDACSYATDLSERALQVARRVGIAFPRSIYFVASDIRSLCFADTTFDIVFSQGVLEHFPDPGPIVQEQARITKTGGLVIIDVPQTFNPYTIWKKHAIRKGTWPYGWETQYSVFGLRKLGRHYGLKPFAVGSWGDTVGYEFRWRTRFLGFMDALVQVYFRSLNALLPGLAHFYRQNISVAFIKGE
jgi:SAM-dependent methyltransferase